MKATLYEALGILPTSSDEDVRASLRRLIRKYYAKTRDGQGNVEEALRFINHASRILSDPDRRVRYDGELAVSTGTTEQRIAHVVNNAVADAGEQTDVGNLAEALPRSSPEAMDEDLETGLDADEQVRHKGELVYPTLFLSAACDHVAAFILTPRSAERTDITCHFLFETHEMEKAGFDPSDAVDFWDLVNRQDWAVCAGVQDGIRSRVHALGYYAPMEDWNLDIRRYVTERIAAFVGDQPL